LSVSSQPIDKAKETQCITSILLSRKAAANGGLEIILGGAEKGLLFI
jgi:hypothetical protein